LGVFWQGEFENTTKQILKNKIDPGPFLASDPRFLLVFGGPSLRLPRGAGGTRGRSSGEMADETTSDRPRL